MRSRSPKGDRDVLSGDLGDAPDLIGEVRERLRGDRLRAVAERRLGLGMNLDDEAVGAGSSSRQRQRHDPVAAPGGVRGVDDHRQVGHSLQRRHRHEVQREPVRALERADAALAQDDVGVVLLEHVLGRVEELLERCREPALEQDGNAGSPRLGEERVVLHVAGTDLDHVGHLGDVLGVADVEELGDDR